MTLAALSTLARIPAGDFLMGSASADEDERPVHRVFVSEFFIGRFPVTQDEYARFVGATSHPAPSIRELPLIATGWRESIFRELSSRYVWADGRPPAGQGSHPVVLVRYDEALAYCRWSSHEAGRAIRLPTEAEWEKAARGGLEGQPYPWGAEMSPSRCNFLTDPLLKRQSGSRPTGTFPPNAYDVCDMSGNVWEWVSDWYGGDYYSVGNARDPQGPETGNLRVVRGGSWVNDDVSMLRSAYRHKVPPDTYAYSIGFRVATSG